MKNSVLILAALTAGVLASCGGGNQFKVEGSIEGAGDTTKVVLETAENGAWLFVDSVEVASDGSFKTAQPAPQWPGIYRLRAGDKTICFPIDSLDRVEVKTSLKAFATDYVLSGSDNAVKVMNIDKKAMQMAAKADPAALKAWKKQLTDQILDDPSGMAAYYAINKYIGSEPLFDILDNQDMKIVGAVANAFNTFRPNDPRTGYLVNTLLDAQRRRREVSQNGNGNVVVASEIPIIDIDLQDNHGKQQKLSKVTSRGKVVVLNFTMYTADFSPMFNKTLADTYRKYAAQGLEIYQVSVDPDEFQWRQSAKNLPWICVIDPSSTRSRNLMSYNVTTIPTSFVINRQGEIVQRVDNASKLDAEIAKYI